MEDHIVKANEASGINFSQTLLKEYYSRKESKYELNN